MFQVRMYTLNSSDETINMPMAATVRKVSMYNSMLRVWAEVDCMAQCCLPRRFVGINTGQPVPEDGVYLDTVQMDSRTVWHIYEVSVR